MAAETSQFAEALREVSERTTAIVREEIELAKAEVTVKAKKLGQAAAVGAAAGIFAVIGLLFLLHGLSYLFGDYLFGDHITFGYFLTAVLLFILGVIAALVARKFVKGGTPPTPQMAIEEAKLVRATVQGARGESTGLAARNPAELAGRPREPAP